MTDANFNVNESEILEFADEHDEDVATLIAQPPQTKDADATTQVQEVGASPAFHNLEELFYSGKLSGTRMATLKAKYSLLFDSLRDSRLRERSSLESAKQLTNDLEKQRLELDKAEDFPEGSNTEVAKLRNDLMTYQNELDLSADRQFQYDFQIENLREERDMLTREYNRIPKADEIDKQLKDTNTAIDELKAEINQNRSKVKQLQEELLAKNKLNDGDRKVLETEQLEQEELKEKLVAAHQKPQQIGKEIDKVLKTKRSVDEKLGVLQDTYSDLTANVNEIIKQNTIIEREKDDLDEDLRKLNLKKEEEYREYQFLSKDLDYSKERENVLLGDRATLELSLKHLNLEKKNLHERHSKLMREKDKNLKSLKKLEVQLKMAKETLANQYSVYDKTKVMVASMPKDDGSLAQKKFELEKEVEATKLALAEQRQMTAAEQYKVHQAIEEEKNLRMDENEYRVEVIELTRLAAIKADEREQKARDCMKAEQRYTRAKEELKIKKMMEEDHKKKKREMEIKLSDYAKVYDLVKNERQKCITTIQASTQKAAEMREKIKILENEIEILRSTVQTKEKQLAKSRLQRINAIVQRDTLRNEVTKLKRQNSHDKEVEKQQKRDIAKMNVMIELADKNAVFLRQRIKNSIQSRNDRGVQLIERNEEVCIFYEKVNIQNSILRNGQVELQSKEDEIKFLTVQVQELKRQVEIARKKIPNKRQMENELVVLQIQLSQCEDRLRDLEDTLGDPTKPGRVRYLEGDDGSPIELSRRIETLEERLADKEEKLLELELLLEQVSRLTERVRNKASLGKDDSLVLAKKVNEYQSKIKELTRKMMATVSELSMNQANCMQLEQVVKEKEATLEQAYVRLERGEAPTEEARLEWEKQRRDNLNRIASKDEQRARDMEEEYYKLPNGTQTTAEPRPNAYIPDDNADLPIPRPYGAYPPFKPMEQGSNMRHIRKPIPKPIEI
ncbi:coiled-coil domain-containing protein 146-like [Convolutriloba macropyga]|uniref:coiled-coil domain-containing protein 146-like n=1 Tax=Convolutriloba macropyga TaxID=536237 RepID=UPI003F51CB58